MRKSTKQIYSYLKMGEQNLTIRARTVFFKFLKNRSQFRCTGLLCSSQLVHLDGKNLTCFIQNLVQNLMNLILRSKSDRK